MRETTLTLFTSSSSTSHGQAAHQAQPSPSRTSQTAAIQILKPSQGQLPHLPPPPPALALHLGRAPSPTTSIPLDAPNAGPTDALSAHSIQSIWAAFSNMSDAQRNMLLKGLIARSGMKQVECICTALNLKSVEGGAAPGPVSRLAAVTLF